MPKEVVERIVSGKRVETTKERCHALEKRNSKSVELNGKKS
jgi:hypothetical protein